jgi:hypothetical protein
MREPSVRRGWLERKNRHPSSFEHIVVSNEVARERDEAAVW